MHLECKTFNIKLVSNIKSCLYVDDSKLTDLIYNPQADLDVLSMWAKTCQHEFNIQKYNIIHFGENNPQSQNFIDSHDGSKQPLHRRPELLGWW